MSLPPRIEGALSSVAGSSLIRSAAQQAFNLSASRRHRLDSRSDPAAIQQRQLFRLLERAASTRFGRDHRFSSIRSVADFQRAVPLRTYEQLWSDDLAASYPVLDDLTWPGRIPYFALTSGTTQGTTKYIPLSREMVASNRFAAQRMVEHYLSHRPGSRLFHGKMFFLGGSTALEQPAPGVAQGDLSAIAAIEVSPFLRPYTFPPLDLALETNWEAKVERFAERSSCEPITLVGGVPSWLLVLFQRLLQVTGKSTIAEVWPSLEVVVHGGVKFDPYRSTFSKVIGSDCVTFLECYPCSEGFVAHGDLDTGLLRLVYDHGIFFEFVPLDELGSDRPTRHWLGNVEPGINYAIVLSTCAGMWAHIVGDTIRFESTRPPLLTFTGRTRYTLSAFGEHLISEEIEAALTEASTALSATIREWHAGPVFIPPLGHHAYIIEFGSEPPDPIAFRDHLDASLRRRNADYDAHRAEGVGLPSPRLVATKPGAFETWMKARGKYGGQNKVPRIDNSGQLTANLMHTLEQSTAIAADASPRL